MRVLATIAALVLIFTAERYAGSYNLAVDLLELLACLAVIIYLARSARNASARRGYSFAFFGGPSFPYLLGVLSYLSLAWFVFSVSDYLFYSDGVPIERTTIVHDKNYAVALSGGGYRAALFHAGILAELENIGLAPTLIGSVSGGSIIGAFYARGGRPQQFVDAVVAGRFNLERRVLRMDNALRLLDSNLRAFLGTPSPSDFSLTHVQAQMLDDLFLHGLLAKDSASSAVAEQMVCVSDILNSEILGITSHGAVIRAINDALARSKFTNPSRKGIDLATFLTDEIIHLPGNERLSGLVAASGAYPGAFPPYPVNRWSNSRSYKGCVYRKPHPS